MPPPLLDEGEDVTELFRQPSADEGEDVTAMFSVPSMNDGEDVTSQFNASAKPSAPDTSFSSAIKQGIDAPLEAIGTTAQVFGATKIGKALKDLTEAPVNYESASERFGKPKEGDFTIAGFAPAQIPRALTEQFGQITGSLISRVAGGIIGGVITGGAGAAGGSAIPVAGTAAGGLGGLGTGAVVGQFAGPFLFGALQIAGPTALERAKRNGRTDPNGEDIAAALVTAAGSGSLDAIGAQYLPGGKKLVGSFVKRLAGAFYGETATESVQSVTEQTGESLGTKEGLKIDPKQAIAEGIIGGLGGSAATAISEPFRPADPALAAAAPATAEAVARTQPVTVAVPEVAPNLPSGSLGPPAPIVAEAEAAGAPQTAAALNQTMPPKPFAPRIEEPGTPTPYGRETDVFDVTTGLQRAPAAAAVPVAGKPLDKFAPLPEVKVEPWKMSEKDAIDAGYVKAYRGESASQPSSADTSWWTTSKDVADNYAREIMGYENPVVREAWIKKEGIPEHDIRELALSKNAEKLAALKPDVYGNPQEVGIYRNSDDSMLNVRHSVIHAPKDAVYIRPENEAKPPAAPAAKVVETDAEKAIRRRKFSTPKELERGDAAALQDKDAYVASVVARLKERGADKLETQTWKNEANTSHRHHVEIAIAGNKPVSAAAVAAYGIKLPEGWTQRGNLWHPPEAKPAPAAPEPAPVAKAMTRSEINERITVLLKAPAKTGGKPRVSFKTQAEEASFRRGFEAANKKPGEPPPEQRSGVPAKEQKIYDAFSQGWSQAQIAIRSLSQPTPAAPAAPVAPAALVPAPVAAAPSRIQLRSGPATYSVVEQLAPQKGDQPGETYFRVKNEQTGEEQTVEAADMKPVKAKGTAPVKRRSLPKLPDTPEGGWDAIDAVQELGGLRSRKTQQKKISKGGMSVAKAWKEVGGHYDGERYLPTNSRRHVLSRDGGTHADEAAQVLYEAGIITSPDPDLMYQALAKAYNARVNFAKADKTREREWKEMQKLADKQEQQAQPREESETHPIIDADEEIDTWEAAANYTLNEKLAKQAAVEELALELSGETEQKGQADTQGKSESGDTSQAPEGELISGGSENTAETASVSNEGGGTTVRMGGQIVATLSRKGANFVPTYNTNGARLKGVQKVAVEQAAKDYTKQVQQQEVRLGAAKGLRGGEVVSQSDMLDANQSEDPLFQQKKDRIEAALDSAIDALKPSKGTLYADPLFIQTVGRPALRAALMVARAAYRAGKTIAEAVADGIAHLKTLVKNLDEAKAREFFFAAGLDDGNPLPGELVEGGREGEYYTRVAERDQGTLSDNAMQVVRNRTTLPDSFKEDVDFAAEMLADDGDLAKSLRRTKSMASGLTEFFSGLTDRRKAALLFLIAQNAATQRETATDPKQIAALKDVEAEAIADFSDLMSQGGKLLNIAGQLYAAMPMSPDAQVMAAEKLLARMTGGKAAEAEAAQAKDTLKTALDEQLKGMDESIRDIMRTKPKASWDEIRQRIADEVVAKMDLATEVERKAATNKIIADLKKRMEKVRKELLAKMSKPGKPGNKTALDKLWKLWELGALDDDALTKVFMEKAGVKEFTPAFRDKLRKMYEDAETAPEGMPRERILGNIAVELALANPKTFSFWWNLAMSISYGNILGAFTTIFVNNPLGSAATSGEMTLMSALSNKGARRETLKGAVKTWARSFGDGVAMMRDLWSTGENLQKVSQFDSALVNSPVELLAKMAEDPAFPKKFRGAAKAVSQYKWVMRAMMAADAVIRWPAREAARFTQAAALAKETRRPGQSLEDAVDELNYPGGRQAAVREARAQAAQERKDGTLKTKLDERLRVIQLLQSKLSAEGTEAATESDELANYGSLLNDQPQDFIGVIASAILKIAFPSNTKTDIQKALGGAAQPFVRFVRTSANATRVMLDYSIGYGAFRYMTRNWPVIGAESLAGGVNLVEGRAGDRLTQVRIQRAYLGIALYAGLAAIYAAIDDDDEDPYIDFIGSGPTTPDERRRLRDTKRMRFNSIKIGDTYVPTNVGPLQPLAGILAPFQRMRDNKKWPKAKDEFDEKVPEMAGVAVARGIADAIMNQSFTRSLADLLTMLNTGKTSFGETPTEFIGKNLAQFIPGNLRGLSQLDEIVSGKKERADGFFDTAANSIAFYAPNGRAVTILGDEVDAGKPVVQRVGEKVFQFTTMTDDKTALFVARNGLSIPDRQRKADGKRQTYPEYSAYMRESGKMMRNWLETKNPETGKTGMEMLQSIPDEAPGKNGRPTNPRQKAMNELWVKFRRVALMKQ